MEKLYNRRGYFYGNKGADFAIIRAERSMPGYVVNLMYLWGISYYQHKKQTTFTPFAFYVDI